VIGVTDFTGAKLYPHRQIVSWQMIKFCPRGALMSSESAVTEVSVLDQNPHLQTAGIMFKRILVATDFSEPADQALKSAIVIGRLFGSKLFLVHAATPVVYTVDTGSIAVEVLDANLDADKERMNQLMSREPGLRELEPKVTVAYCSAIDLIEQVCNEENIDLIVAGSHGARGLERLALGSVAESILHRAKCPVMIVGPNCRTDHHPFRSILFATDLSTTGLRGAQYASGLAERFHANLTFLHVMNEEPVAPRVEMEVIEDRITQQLRELLPPDVSRYCRAKVRLEKNHDVAKKIAMAAHSEQATLIIVGFRDRGLSDHNPWSKLSHLIGEARCPVLGIRGRLV
jgi:nucleotide-binding universal stress UspA family protein